MRSDELHAAIFIATFRRRIARDWPRVAVAFGAQPAAVDAMVREPVRHCLGAITGQFLVDVLRPLIVGKTFNADSPVRMVFEGVDSFIQCAFGVRRQIRFASLKPYI